MGSSSIAAFVATSRNTGALNTPALSSLLFIPKSAPAAVHVASTTAMSVVAGPTVAACQQAALGFFSGIRIPASLIAGSSVAAVFSLVSESKCTDGLSRLEVGVLRLYHAISILCLCLSMLTISTTTTACTLLLLTSKLPNAATTNGGYSDIYHFLRSEFNYEFVMTRWAFCWSIVLFLTGVAGRILLELDLLKPERRTEGILVLSTMMAVIAGILSNINLTLNCWSSLIGMTGELIQVRRQVVCNMYDLFHTKNICRLLDYMDPSFMMRFISTCIAHSSWTVYF